jgi:hypothetical protein
MERICMRIDSALRTCQGEVTKVERRGAAEWRRLRGRRSRRKSALQYEDRVQPFFTIRARYAFGTQPTIPFSRNPKSKDTRPSTDRPA